MVVTLRSIYTYNHTFELRLSSVQLTIMYGIAGALIFETASLRDNFFRTLA
jgi:hypothetical protein